MKKICCICLLVGLLLALLPQPAFAADESVSVTIDGQPVVFPDQQPVYIDRYLYIPLRAVFETLGFNVEWDHDARSVLMSNETYNVVIMLGRDLFLVDDIFFYGGGGSVILSGRTLLNHQELYNVLRQVGLSMNRDWNPITYIDITAAQRPDILLSWQAGYDWDGVSNDNILTFADGSRRLYLAHETVLMTDDGFSPIRLLDLPGTLAMDTWVPLSAIPEQYSINMDTAMFMEHEGETYTLFFAGIGDVPMQTFSLGLGAPGILFIGGEPYDESGAELLEPLMERLWSAFYIFRSAIIDDPEGFYYGTFARDGILTADDADRALVHLRAGIASTRHIATLGNFVVFEGPYPMIWDRRTDYVYFVILTTPHGGSFLRVDFSDPEIFLDWYFLG